MRTFLLILPLVGCSTSAPEPGAPNILVIISDDIGADKTGAYGSANTTYTPTLDALAEQGMRFDNAYSNPTCSPSRATLLTGRLATQTGVGRWIFPNTEAWDMQLDELTIPEMLQSADAEYTSAAVGKWHTVTFTREDAPRHPLNQGFAHHRGALANPLDAVQQGNTPRSYVNWEKNVDGEVEWTETYMTTDTVDEAIGMIDDLPEPWFLWVALNAAHAPWHVPPDDLNPLGVTDANTDAERYDADTLAFDMELDRLLESIDPEVREDLTLVYLADNGTPGDVITSPYDPARGKATTYEGGVKVPMIVVSPHVAEPGSRSSALVHFADLFPTVAALADIEIEALRYPSGRREGEALDLYGTSLLPLLADPEERGGRELMFTEAFYPNGPGPYTYRHRAVRSATHKLRRIETEGSVRDLFYDLDAGEYDEGVALSLDGLTTEEQAQYDDLLAEMERLNAELQLTWD